MEDNRSTENRSPSLDEAAEGSGTNLPDPAPIQNSADVAVLLGNLMRAMKQETRDIMHNMNAQLQVLVADRERQQVPPPVHVPPPAPAAVAASGTLPLATAAARDPMAPVPPLAPAAPQVVVPAWADASKLSKKFLKHRPPTFNKMADDSMYPAHWIRDLKRIFEVLQCVDEDKIRCAVYQLRGEADSWWWSEKENFELLHPNPTWELLKETFLENYFSKSFRDKKQAEFTSLIQGSRSVLEFQQLFEELFYFAPVHMKPEAVKARLFEKELRPSISTSVVLHEYPSYARVVQAAKVVEDRQRENYRAIQANKRPMTSSNYRGPSKFQRGSYSTLALTQNYRQGATKAPRLQANPHYGAQTIQCYNCLGSGHISRGCPYPKRGGTSTTAPSKPPLSRPASRPVPPPTSNRPQRQVYALTNDEAQADPTVITGMVSICSQPAYGLFDSGATHSFVSPMSAKRLGVNSKRLSQNLMASTLTGNVVELDALYEPCPVWIDGKKLVARLIELNMRHFDVILGMDWLSIYGASLVCAKKRIVFKPDEDVELVFEGYKSRKPKKITISALQVQKLIEEGC
ncbi:uncharacterized protein LOC122655382 [Telopea speciosissima]|uniref:uncharacterized protein LOC122655382 n=1 Tax=Telopea speciosissima TaxID=54955 RepID=UPI001CC6D89E|nr:uncharacterized protein LOC122655382 [Telopea speciosissima]